MTRRPSLQPPTAAAPVYAEHRPQAGMHRIIAPDLSGRSIGGSVTLTYYSQSGFLRHEESAGGFGQEATVLMYNGVSAAEWQAIAGANTHDEWVDAVASVAQRARQEGRAVSL